MKHDRVELWVGLFVVIGIICLGYLTIKLGKMKILGENYYELTARFQSITGLKPGASVEIAGVPVGQVAALKLEPEKQVALVRLQIRKDIQLTDDVVASVRTSGLIGDKFIKLSPGGSDVILKPGDMIIETESPLDIEELVSKFVFDTN